MTGARSVSGATSIRLKFGVKPVNKIEEHMVSLWQITTMPLRATLSQDNVLIKQSITGTVISTIPQAIFMSLEPKEIVEVLNRDLSKITGEPVSILRTDFSGHKKNPFSSQN